MKLLKETSIQNEIKSRDVDVEVLAIRIGLDRSVFQQCMESGNATNRIKEDIEAAMKRRLRGTPTFFVEDKKYIGNVPESEIKKLLKTGKK